MKKIGLHMLYITPIVVILLVVAHTDYEFVSRNDIVVIGDTDTESAPVSNEELENVNFTLEKRFEKRELIDNYWVETYREYEIYTDEKGNIIEAIPTSTFDYIRYWANE
ncbi:hypothetical protein [Bacillus sp. FJAT-47783]|uniref:hypothetical protein n=1 Tax=Bacillus sp. FJAT-47783 TaxID=2922712 RepID=UPI001FAD9D5F|nr:hypothetical protein [Bacillus sp. FJAT-47783]